MLQHNSQKVYSLAAGQMYEADLVKRFRKAGFKSALYSANRQDISEESVNVPMAALKWGHWKRLFTLFQRDIWVRTPKRYQVIDHETPKEVLGYKCWNVECKSRNLKGFSYETIMVGKSERWDILKFPVHYFVVIDQLTNEARYIDVKATQEAGLWKFVPSRQCRNGSTTDDHYEVATEVFQPIGNLFELLHKVSEK